MFQLGDVMPTPTLVFGPMLERFSVALNALLGDPTTPVTVDGATYAIADLRTLYNIQAWAGVKAAIEKIEVEAQSAGIGSRQATMADYDALVKRERELAGALPDGFAGKIRDGIRVRYVVPA